MIRVLLIGTGRVAGQLARVFQQADEVRLLGLSGRERPARGDLARYAWFPLEEEFPAADVYLLAVSDDAISGLCERLGPLPGIVAHTSGRTPMDALRQERRGVFYPLQSFSGNREINFQGLPICIESADRDDLEILRKLGDATGAAVHEVDSGARAELHLAAVLVNNFTNHLFVLAAERLKDAGLDFGLLLPLIRETTDRLATAAPRELQTGPAVRDDQGTIQGHLDLLDPGQTRALYELMSSSISAYHGRKL